MGINTKVNKIILRQIKKQNTSCLSYSAVYTLEPARRVAPQSPVLHMAHKNSFFLSVYEQRVQSVRLPALHAPMWPHFSAPTSFLRSNESMQLLEQPGKTLPGWYCPLCFSLPQPAELHSSISAFSPARLWSPDAAASPAPGSAGCQTADRRHLRGDAHREYPLMGPFWSISPSAWVHTFRATVLLKSKLHLKMCQLKRCSLDPLSTPHVKHDTGFFFSSTDTARHVCVEKSSRHVLIKYKLINSLTLLASAQICAF